MTPACAGLAPMFDADVPGESFGQRRQRLVMAMGICNNRCPVTEACEQARQAGPSEGVWNGQLHESLHTKRNRAMEASA